jgi:hypothetical protein
MTDSHFGSSGGSPPVAIPDRSASIKSSPARVRDAARTIRTALSDLADIDDLLVALALERFEDALAELDNAATEMRREKRGARRD